MDGTATGGSTETVVDGVGLIAPDDYWVGHYVYILADAGGEGAAPEGEERPITDYVQSSGTLTVAPAFSAAVADGDTYEVLPLRRAEIIAAIQAGVRAAGVTWVATKVDTTTVTIAADDHDYDLPTDVVRLLVVWVRTSAGDAWVEVPGRMWRVSGEMGDQELLFDDLSGLGADDTVRLEYLARAEELSADSDTLGLGEPAEREMVEFVVAHALFWLHDQAAARAPEGAGFRPHLTQAQYYREVAKEIRTAAWRWQGRGTVRSERWARHRG